MKYRITILSEAENDLEDAYLWYELNQPGLGKKLFEAVEESFSLISQEPSIGKKMYADLRRMITNKFPYGIYYFTDVEKHEIKIIGILHFSRSLDIIKKRF